MQEAYRPDLAYIHDSGFGQPAQHAAQELLTALRRQGLSGGLVIDLGCGSGILSQVMADAGYAVLGIDLSTAMVEMARQRVPRGEFRVGSFVEMEWPPCVAVAAVGEIFNYLFDDRNTRQTMGKVLRRIHSALVPGGVLIFDVAGPGRVPGRGPRQKYVTGDGWTVLVTAEEDQQRQTLTRQITSFRRVGDLYRRDEELHRLRLYRPAEVARQLRQIGFRVKPLAAYTGWRFPQGWRGFLARTP